MIPIIQIEKKILKFWLYDTLNILKLLVVAAKDTFIQFFGGRKQKTKYFSLH